MKKLYTQNEVSKIFPDVPNKTLIYWARQDFVEWAEEVEDGRGIHRKYSLFNLYQIAIVRELAGIALPAFLIRYTMDKYFKDFVKGGPMLPDLIDVGKNRASESSVMENYLVIPKIVLFRRFGLQPNKDISLCEPENLGEFFNLKKESAVITIIRLPLIAQFVQSQIEKLDRK